LKVFQLVVAYLEPTQSVVQVYANTEEDAVNIVRLRLHEAGIKNITFTAIEEVADIPDELADIADTNRTIN